MKRPTFLAAVLLGVGMFAIQLAWIIVVPPYGGMDEIDHAYRAASVARGYWSPPLQQPARGRGDLIKVPVDIVSAAHKPCASLKYTGYANCNAVTPPDAHGNVLVASAAARYNPLFYWIVGTVARPFHGDGALIAMRLCTAVMCAALFATAAMVSLRSGRSMWPIAGLLLCATPTLVDSAATAAPNGVQMFAGLLMWTAGLALTLGYGPARQGRHPIGLLVLGIGVVVTVHTTGPLWALLFLGVTAIVARPSRLRSLVDANRRKLVLAAATTALIAMSAVVWTVSHRTNLPWQERAEYGAIPWGGLIQQPVVWVLQTMGGVPWRNMSVPTAVFAMGLSTLLALLVAAVRVGTTRPRVGVAVIVGSTLMIPIPLTLMSYAYVGFSWQGRYALPFAFGLPVLCAWVLDGHKYARTFSRFSAFGIAAVAVGMQATSLLNLHRIESAPGHGTWSPPSNALLVILCAGCLTLWATGITIARHGSMPSCAVEPDDVSLDQEVYSS